MSRRTSCPLLQPLSLLPSQTALRDIANLSPEMRLVVAILEDAVRSVVRYGNPRRRREHVEFLQARAWLLDDSRDWPFAFANVCDLLGLDVRAVRQSLDLEALLSGQKANKVNWLEGAKSSVA
jgi:hypothetical protein